MHVKHPKFTMPSFYRSIEKLFIAGLLTAGFALPATIKDLGAFAGKTSEANAISSTGQVVGESSNGTASRAFLYTGVLTDIGTLGGDGSYAYGVNSAGQVVGQSDNSKGQLHAFVYKNGSMTDLGTLGKEPTLISFASGINTAGDLVGTSNLIISGQQSEHAFLYTGGTMKDLGSMGGLGSRGHGINSSGQVVGNVDAANGTHAFVYTGGVMKDIGTLGGDFSGGIAINDSGQVVGSSTLKGSNVEHAFLYSADVMKDLGTLGGNASIAKWINASGLVVGYSQISVTSRVPHAFLYSGGAMTDLNSLLPANSGWVLESATGINDTGQIVGYGTLGGQRRAFLMDGAASTTATTSQTITFAPLSSVAPGTAPFDLIASASSGLAVSFSSTTPAVCTVAGSTVTLVSAGTCSITAGQAGNSTYSAAASVTQSFAVTSGGVTSQTISFAALPDVTYGVPAFSLTASASSGLPVVYKASPATVCTIAGSTITIIGGGVCSVTATQTGNAAASAVGALPRAFTGFTRGARIHSTNATYTDAPPVTQTFTVGAAAGGPSITPGGVVPVYSSSTTIQPGSWISIYGSNLAAATATWNNDFPTSLGGVTVTIGGKSAYLWLVSPTQINLQAPDDSTIGTVSVTLTNSKGSWTTTASLGPLSPSFSLLDGKHVAGIILRTDGSGAYGAGTYDILGPTGTSLGYKTLDAKLGDTVELFGVGFGSTDPVVAAGKSFSGSAPTTNQVQLTIGGVPVTPSYAGLSLAGLYQINVTIPKGLGTGDVVLASTTAGVQSQTGVVISLQ